jgi:hypothetical protein
MFNKHDKAYRMLLVADGKEPFVIMRTTGMRFMGVYMPAHWVKLDVGEDSFMTAEEIRKRAIAIASQENGIELYPIVV